MDDYAINKIIDFVQPTLYQCDVGLDYISNQFSLFILAHSEQEVKQKFYEIINKNKENIFNKINKAYEKYIKKYYWEENFVKFDNLQEFDEYIKENLEIKIYDPENYILTQLYLMV
jgi:hypothetical protein